MAAVPAQDKCTSTSASIIHIHQVNGTKHTRGWTGTKTWSGRPPGLPMSAACDLWKAMKDNRHFLPSSSARTRPDVLHLHWTWCSPEDRTGSQKRKNRNPWTIIQKRGCSSSCCEARKRLGFSKQSGRCTGGQEDGRSGHLMIVRNIGRTTSNSFCQDSQVAIVANITNIADIAILPILQVTSPANSKDANLCSSCPSRISCWQFLCSRLTTLW